jgi:hypothetical protein
MRVMELDRQGRDRSPDQDPPVVWTDRGVIAIGLEIVALAVVRALGREAVDRMREAVLGDCLAPTREVILAPYRQRQGIEIERQAMPGGRRE